MNDLLLVATSGGMDSMSLVTILHSLGYRMELAHVNYGMRGNESDKDQEAVEEWGESRSINVHTKRADARKGESAGDGSFQMRARRLRYDWFNELLGTIGGSSIVTAHHADDNLETLIQNLIRGTGLKGMAGMSPLSGALARPLLCVSKAEIRDYARAKDVGHREDRTNLTCDYERNEIRHNVVGRLLKIKPGLMKSYVSSWLRWEETLSFLEEQTQKSIEAHLTRAGDSHYLQTAWMDGAAGQLHVLYSALQHYNFSYSRAVEVGRAVLGKKTGKLFFSPTHEMNLDRGVLVIRPRPGGLLDPKIKASLLIPRRGVYTTEDGTFSLEVSGSKQVTYDSVPNMALLDWDKLKLPLCLRAWEPGDRVVPLGMKGRVKVSDFLVNLKMSRFEKENVKVLVSGTSICWVVGYRVCEPFRVESKTRKIARISWKPAFKPSSGINKIAGPGADGL